MKSGVVRRCRIVQTSRQIARPLWRHGAVNRQPGTPRLRTCLLAASTATSCQHTPPDTSGEHRLDEGLEKQAAVHDLRGSDVKRDGRVQRTTRDAPNGKTAHRDPRADGEADELWCGCGLHGRNAQHHKGERKCEDDRGTAPPPKSIARRQVSRRKSCSLARAPPKSFCSPTGPKAKVFP